MRRAGGSVRWAVLALLALVLTLPAGAEELPEAVVRNGPYHWGEAEAETRSEAEQTAIIDMMSRIRAVFTGRDETTIAEDATGVNESYRQKLRMWSRMELRGLQKQFSKGERRGHVRAFVYIHHDSLAVSLDLTRERIRSFVAAAEKARRGGAAGDALRNYYWGLLVCKLLPDTLDLGFAAGQTDPDVAIVERMRELIQQLKLEPGEPVRDDFIGGIYVPLRATLSGRLVRNLDYTYYGGNGMEYGSVHNGTGDLTLYQEPAHRRMPVSITLFYEYEVGLRQHPELYQLHNDLELKPVEARKTVRLVFPWIPEAGGSTEEPPPPPRPEPPVSRGILTLVQIKDAVEFQKSLRLYEQNNRMLVAQQKAPLEGACQAIYAAVVDVQESQVEELYYVDGGSYVGLRQGARISNLEEHYSGQGKGLLYIGDLTGQGGMR